MNTRLIALLTCGLAITISASPQTYFYNEKYYDKDLLYELSLSTGGINCLTDLGGRSGQGKGFLKDLNVKHTRLTAGIGAGFVYRYKAGLRLDINTGTLYGDDAILENDQSDARMRYLRNLHFRTSLLEFLLMAELFPLSIFFMSDKNPRLSPYVLGGIGIFSFNPQANLNGNWINLQPLRTEGQGFAEYPDRKPYNRTQVNFPVGAGIKYELSALFNLKLEVLHRITTTDYLDDVSTTYIEPGLFYDYLSATNAGVATLLHDRRGALNPQHGATPGAKRGGRTKNDAYFSAVFKLGFVIGRERR